MIKYQGRLLLLIVISSCFYHPALAVEVNLSINIEKNYTITFVNYDPELIDTTNIMNFLPDALYFGGEDPLNYDYSYTLNYNLEFASEAFENDFNDYIDSIAVVDDWTSSLNETALQEQVEKFERKDIFERQNGTSIDAQKVENYLNEKKTISEDPLTYNIFILNLSRLDTSTTRHWFTADQKDIDAEIQRFYWRLEWDYPLNYDVRFPFAAYSNKTDTSFLDLTAFQWYLKWRVIWNINVNSDESYLKPIQDLIFGNTTAQQKMILTPIIANWLFDWIMFVYNMTPFDLVELNDSVKAKFQIVYNSTQVTEEELRWIVNTDYVAEQISLIKQSTDISIELNFIDIEEDDLMESFVNTGKVNYVDLQHKPPPFENWSYYDGMLFYTKMIDNETIFNTYFDMGSAETKLAGLILVLDNCSFMAEEGAIPWSGGLYSGVGGGGRTAILFELDRAFMPNGDKKAGITRILVHELGHAIGLPHTFYNRFTSDFSNDVMGYYPGTASFTNLTLQAYWSNSVIIKMISCAKIPSKNYDLETADKINELYDEAVNAFNSKEFLTAYSKLVALEKIMLEFPEPPPETSTGTSTETQNGKSSNLNSFILGVMVIISITTIKKYRIKRKAKFELD